MKKFKIQFKIKNFILLLFSFGFMLLPTVVLASELKLSSPVSEVGTGQQLQVGLFLSTGEENINALEGKIIFPAELLKLKEVRDGNTIVNFWVEKPIIDSSGAIVFSGITPGGVNVENGFIFSAIFETIKSGVATLRISEVRALLNDGQGSAAALDISPLQIVISEATSPQKSAAIEVSDTLPPEQFKPEIAQDQTVFNGKYFLAFATQDKGSGMARYEVREIRQKPFSFFYKWKEAASPYLLADQSLKSFIYVKAVDLNGNVRIELISPQNPLLWYENYLVYVIIILSLIVFLILWKILRRKKDLMHP